MARYKNIRSSEIGEPENFSDVGKGKTEGMVSEIGAAALLKGVRGEKKARTGAVEIIQRFSLLVTDLPMIQETDLNPVIAYEDQVAVVDARIAI